MTDLTDSELLALAAQRAGDRKFYLASALREYQDLRRIDDASLAQKLGCDAETLDRLRLCRRPATESDTFRTDVQAIAQRFGLAAIDLAVVLREVSSLEAMRSAEEGQPSAVLMAARDRKGSRRKKDDRRAP